MDTGNIAFILICSGMVFSNDSSVGIFLWRIGTTQKHPQYHDDGDLYDGLGVRPLGRSRVYIIL